MIEHLQQVGLKFHLAKPPSTSGAEGGKRGRGRATRRAQAAAQGPARPCGHARPGRPRAPPPHRCVLCPRSLDVRSRGREITNWLCDSLGNGRTVPCGSVCLRPACLHAEMCLYVHRNQHLPLALSVISQQRHPLTALHARRVRLRLRAGPAGMADTCVVSALYHGASDLPTRLAINCASCDYVRERNNDRVHSCSSASSSRCSCSCSSSFPPLLLFCFFFSFFPCSFSCLSWRFQEGKKTKKKKKKKKRSTKDEGPVH